MRLRGDERIYSMKKRGFCEERFWSRIKVNSEGCWEWQGYRCLNGYGQICVNYKRLSVHRLAWELKNGNIPKGLFVCHHCDNPPCINPDHLFLGTQLENQKDAQRKGRKPSGENNPNAKLKRSDIPVIRSLLSVGWRGTEIARLYGVGSTTISHIKLGYIWRNSKVSTHGT